jgi:hypothetical protein
MRGRYQSGGKAWGTLGIAVSISSRAREYVDHCTSTSRTAGRCQQRSIFHIGERDRRVCGWFIVLQTVLIPTILASSNTFRFAVFARASADDAVLVYALSNVRSVIAG